MQSFPIQPKRSFPDDLPGFPWSVSRNEALGDGTTTNRSTPVTVTGLTGVTSLTVGGSHSCALLSSKALKCWGYNANGQISDGAAGDSHTPSGVIAQELITRSLVFSRVPSGKLNGVFLLFP